MLQKLRNQLVMSVVDAPNSEKCLFVVVAEDVADVVAVLVAVTLNHVNANHHNLALSICKLIKQKVCQQGLYFSLKTPCSYTISVDSMPVVKYPISVHEHS